MNEHTSDQSHLGRLLDEASAHYNPQPNVARFESMLHTQHRRRAGMIVWSAAACFALVGGTAFAFNQRPSENKLAPANSETQHGSDWTGVSTTEHHSSTTLAEHHEPSTTVHHDESTTAPPTTEKHHEPPKSTEPPHNEPGTTLPHEGEPTTTEGHHYEWSIHQVKGSSDAEPPTEVFWGTGNTGDRIRFESAYGSGTAYPNGDGNWEVHITFEGAPVGVAFEIHLFAPGHTETYWFTYLG